MSSADTVQLRSNKRRAVSPVHDTAAGNSLLSDFEIPATQQQHENEDVADNISQTKASAAINPYLADTLQHAEVSGSALRMKQLKTRLAAARRANSKSVQEEKARNDEGSTAKQHDGAHETDHDDDTETKADSPATATHTLNPLLNDTASTTLYKHNIQKQKGYWKDETSKDVHQMKAINSAYNKRVSHLATQQKPTAEQEVDADSEEKAVAEQHSDVASQSTTPADPYSYLRHKPTTAAIDAMVNELQEVEERRSKYSRRRAFDSSEDPLYISERNRKFNQKASRAFDEHTAGIKQSLERGTAL